MQTKEEADLRAHFVRDCVKMGSGEQLWAEWTYSWICFWQNSLKEYNSSRRDMFSGFVNNVCQELPLIRLPERLAVFRIVLLKLAHTDFILRPLYCTLSCVFTCSSSMDLQETSLRAAPAIWGWNESHRNLRTQHLFCLLYSTLWCDF